MKNDILTTNLDELPAAKGKQGRRSFSPVVGDKSTMSRTVRGVPEVMVKIAGSAKDASNVRRLVKYISKDGSEAVEDENGLRFTGEHTADDALFDWMDIPASGKRREAMHIVFSMPRGTPENEVGQAVREFSAKEFDNHRFLFAQHYDQEHPHVHVVLNLNPIKGTKRLNPRKKDLQRWRERFAERLRANGIEANATPRAARGVTRRHISQPVLEIDNRAIEAEQAQNRSLPELYSKVTQSARQRAVDELNGKPATDIPREALEASRRRTVAEYGKVIDGLVSSPDAADKQLAADAIRFVQAMPPVMTQHDELVEQTRRHIERTVEQSAEQGRAPNRRQAPEL